jgi:hypothetical protein
MIFPQSSGSRGPKHVTSTRGTNDVFVPVCRPFITKYISRFTQAGHSRQILFRAKTKRAQAQIYVICESEIQIHQGWGQIQIHQMRPSGSIHSRQFHNGGKGVSAQID